MSTKQPSTLKGNINIFTEFIDCKKHLYPPICCHCANNSSLRVRGCRSGSKNSNYCEELWPLMYFRGVSLKLFEGTLMRKTRGDVSKCQPDIKVNQTGGGEGMETRFSNAYFFSRHSTYSFFFLRLS